MVSDERSHIATVGERAFVIQRTARALSTLEIGTRKPNSKVGSIMWTFVALVVLVFIIGYFVSL